MCAEIYHCADFIISDPVQFPHRYTLKQDIEISGLLTAIMSFGNRKQILKKADELHRLMGDSPYQFKFVRPLFLFYTVFFAALGSTIMSFLSFL